MSLPTKQTNEFDQAFPEIYRNFVYAIEAYRRLIQNVQDSYGTSQQAENERAAISFKRVLEHLPRADREELLRGLGEFSEALEAFSEGAEGSGEGVEADGTTSPDETHKMTIRMTRPGANAAFRKLLEQVRRSTRTGPAVQQAMIHRAVLTGLVGQFEVLVADIVHQFYRKAPSALDSGEKVLSLGDLREIGSVDAAVDFLIERKVDSLLAQSLDDWAEFFSSRLKIDIDALAPDWEVFREYTQRRHILVHAGGRVTRRYLTNVHEDVLAQHFDKPTVGDVVETNVEYVETALEHFEVLGLLLCFTAWVKLRVGSLGAMEDLLLECVYERMVEGRWELALALADAGKQSARLSGATQTVCRMNSWICRKELGLFHECATEVEEFDDSALDGRFRLVRLAVLGNADKFFELLEATSGADLDRQAWHEWPAFREMRTDGRFAEFVERYASSTAKEGEGGRESGARSDPSEAAGLE